MERPTVQLAKQFERSEELEETDKSESGGAGV
jgi:hypothetical protein